MASLLDAKPSMAYRTFQDAMKAFLELGLKPVQQLHVFQADEVEEAFHQFQNRGITEKRIIELYPGKTILASVKTKPKYDLDANATYVIAGGLGGLGRSFARWMASRGARNLLLLSRSGAASAAAKSLVNELEQQGVLVSTPEIDISNGPKLDQLLKGLAKSMPPIKGCIQATAALRDNMFEKMTYEDWDISTRAKVTGSWNLHKYLPSGLDFFVCISSVNGIFGGRAQANYAAGNTFKDALARYRIAHGQKAISIDLGMMVGEGVVAESEYLLASMRRIGHLMDIELPELLALLEYYCDKDLPLQSESDSQILVGVEMPSAVVAKGIDLHHSIHRPIFSHLFRMSPADSDVKSATSSTLHVDRAVELRKAGSEDEAVALVVEWFSNKVAQVLGLSKSDIDASKPVHVYGIDSLVAVDLKNWFTKEIGADITVFVLLGNMPLQGLCAIAAEKSIFRSASPS